MGKTSGALGDYLFELGTRHRKREVQQLQRTLEAPQMGVELKRYPVIRTKHLARAIAALHCEVGNRNRRFLKRDEFVIDKYDPF